MDEIVGCSRTTETLSKARDLGVIDRGEPDPEKAVEGADLVVISVPMGVAGELTLRILPRCPEGALVTDMGSVKGAYVRAVEGRVPEGVGFIGGHPIAGTENSGVAASFNGLFRNARCVLTPTPNTAAWAVEAAKALWKALGADVILMDPDRHDEVLGAVSHLPHVLACSAMNALPEDVLEGFAGGGFRDFSRIASSDPGMWRDICLSNRQAILEWISRYEETLREMKDLIDRRDGEGLREAFSRAKARRDALIVLEKSATRSPSGTSRPDADDEARSTEGGRSGG